MSLIRPARVLTFSLSAGAIVALAACGSSGGGTLAKATLSPSASASATPSASASATASPASGTGTGTGTGTGGGTGGGTGAGGGAGGGGGTGGPTATLTLTMKPACPSGTNLVHFDGNGATLSWTTTGATGVSIKLDGGLFGSFGPNGSATIPFECTASPNTTQTHTYTLVTTGGAQLQRSVTASALVNEITDVGSAGPTAAPMTPTAGPSASASP